ncbi:helix-turn-helix domain-containing protein [Bifidobacterium sp.]|uniref:helix-turn-helix domain-containing protein n=1 Tax=Bifidobacterium sp. TaxID=41200 RepID=UPI0025C52A60|nr:helix-turn-helix transcriptional regulator [Bifidobacterium sp.]MCI1635163.1 helix-turn-helix domain-containing protein [Bifidobacterium sp.]
MANNIQKRSERFAQLFGAELKGTIASHGYSQGQVADELGHARSTMSKWLNAKPPIDVAVARKICDYIGADISDVTNSANKRLHDELGPWPPITVNPDALSEEEKKRLIMEKVRRGDMSLAANYDPDKEAERDYYPDAGA